MTSQTRTAITTGDGIRIVYRFDGDENKPVLLLSNSIGTDLHMWDGQVSALTEHFRLAALRRARPRRFRCPERRVFPGPTGARRGGTAGCPGPAAGARAGPVSGRKSSRSGWGSTFRSALTAWCFSNTAAYLGPANQWDRPIAELLEASDMQVTAERFLHNWFPARMLQGDDEVVEGFRRTLLATQREGVAGSWAAVRDYDLRRTATLIHNPTLVIAGEYDTVTSADHGKELAATVPGARFTVLPTVHMANVEGQAEFVDAVVAFLTEQS